MREMPTRSAANEADYRYYASRRTRAAEALTTASRSLDGVLRFRIFRSIRAPANPPPRSSASSPWRRPCDVAAPPRTRSSSPAAQPRSFRPFPNRGNTCAT